MKFRGHVIVSAMACLFVSACASPPGTRNANGRNGKFIPHPGAIPDQFIVVLQPASVPNGDLRRVSDEMLLARGGTKLAAWEHALLGFSARMPAAEAMALSEDPRVAYVEEDTEVYPSTLQSGPAWGLDRLDQRDLPLDQTYQSEFSGSGVHAYIIDTGIRVTHTEFGGRAVHGATFVADGNGSNDCNGHGTHVAATVGGATYGVAKGVTLHAVRVFPCTGSTPNSVVISAVEWVTANHVSPAVANMSLGGGVSRASDDAVGGSIAAGVTYAIAAGNDYGASACTKSPARVPEAMTVGATGASDARAAFSNIGTCVDLFAPGEAITSAWFTSDTATNTISGTSMATPHVAGLAALYLEKNPAASPDVVARMLVVQATPGKISSPGTGSPNLLVFSGFLNGTDATAPVMSLGPPAPPAPLGTPNPLSGTAVTITASASDDSGAVRRVEFFVDGKFLSGDDAAPFSAIWNTTEEGNGPHTVSAMAYDPSGNLGTAERSVETANTGLAAFDPALGVPACANAGSSCSSGRLSEGRAGLGPESFAPNTLFASCADGASGSFRKDESIDRIVVRRIGAGSLAAGANAQIEVRVFTYSSPGFMGATILGADKLDLYLAGDATNPTWAWLATLTPAVAGQSTLTATTRLPAGSAQQAIRARYRLGGAAAPCGSGIYDDHDDLAFAVDATPDTQAPATAITSPGSGAVVKGSVSVNATASDAFDVVRVDLYRDAVLLGTDTTAPYSTVWNTTGVPNGAYALTSRAYDFAGNAGVSSVVNVTVDNDLIAPLASMTAPFDGATVSEITALAATASDNLAVNRVSFHRGTTFLGTDYSAPFTWSWNSRTAVNGSYALTAKAYDAAGNVGTSAPITVTVDNVNLAPVTSMTAPANGAILTRTVSVSATATDDLPGVARVEFYAGTTLIGTDTTSPWSMNWETRTFPNGPQALTSKAFDTYGASGTSAAVNVTLSNDLTPPVASIVSPSEGASVQGIVTVTVSATDDVGIAYAYYYLDGSQIGSQDQGAPWTWTWDTRAVPNGSHTLSCTVRDSWDVAANTGTCPVVTVSVDNAPTPPVTAITSPAEGSVVTGTGSQRVVTLDASATDDVAVARVEFYVGTTQVCSDSYAPYSCAWSSRYVVNGPQTLTTVAFDQAGNAGTSAPVHITLTHPGNPTTSITSPSQGAVLSGVVSITAVAAAEMPPYYSIWYVEIFDGPTPICTSHAAPYACAWDTSAVPNGSHSLSSRATDSAGRRTNSAAIPVTVAN